MMITVRQEVRTCAIDDQNMITVRGPALEVETYRNRRAMVILRMGKRACVVLAKELKEAIENTTNVNR